MLARECKLDTSMGVPEPLLSQIGGAGFLPVGFFLYCGSGWRLPSTDNSHFTRKAVEFLTAVLGDDDVAADIDSVPSET